MAVQLDHPDFPAPDPDAVLWRYTPLNKLLALLTKQVLYFPSLETLRRDDPLEGMPTAATRRLNSLLKQSPEARKQFFGEDMPEFVVELMFGGLALFSDICFVSCWHENRHEFAALWNLYSGFSDGVAIKSSVRRVAKSIASERNFILGRVKYEDYDLKITNPGQAFDAAFMKRLSFSHEAEVRVLHRAEEFIDMSGEVPTPGSGGSWNAKLVEKRPPGLTFECNVDQLVEEVVVSPYTDPWVTEVVAAVLAKLGCKARVSRSKLMESLP